MKTVQFIQEPKNGDVIKVYDNGSSYFSICKGVSVKENDNTIRQVAIVERVNKVFETSQCDFFLGSEKVIERVQTQLTK
jgi:hypothetical protein